MTSSKISLFPDFLQTSHFLDLASHSSVKKEPEWMLTTAGENCTECVQELLSHLTGDDPCPFANHTHSMLQ